MKKNYSKADLAKTEKAWSKLKGRLENDELLNEFSSKPNFSYKLALSYAAVFILIITVATFLFTGKQVVNESDLITLTNDTPGTTYVTKLDDGSYVYLSEKTSVTHPLKFSSSKRELALDGEAYFEIARDENKPFVIEAGEAMIEVLGTTFDLKTTKGETKISVRTGRIKITQLKGGTNTEVIAGESAILDGNGLRKYNTADESHFLKYKLRMHFKDESLGNIADVINKAFPQTKIKLEPGIEKRELTATFSGENPDSMVQLICSAMDLKYTQEGDIIKIHL